MDYVWLCQFDTINYELGLGQVSLGLNKCNENLLPTL